MCWFNRNEETDTEKIYRVLSKLVDIDQKSTYIHNQILRETVTEFVSWSATKVSNMLTDKDQ
jgi:hypothetical protein